MKKTGLILLLITFFMSSFQMVWAESNTNLIGKYDESKSIYLNSVKMDCVILNVENRHYIALRDACYYLNGDIQVDSINKSINIVTNKKLGTKNVANNKQLKGQLNLSVQPSNYTITVNGLNGYLNPVIYQNTVFVPVAYMAEIFGKSIQWIQSDKKLVLTDSIDKIKVTVNNTPIKESDIQYHYQLGMKQLADQNGGESVKLSVEEDAALRQNIVDFLIESAVIDNKMKNSSLVRYQDELRTMNQEIQSLVDYYGGSEVFRKTLATYPVSLYKVILDLKDQYLRQLYFTRMTAKTVASEATLKAYYDDHIPEFSVSEKVVAKHILILTVDESGASLNATDKAKALKQAEDLLARVKKGEDFQQLMNLYSEDPGSANYPDGYTFGKGEMVEAFETAAFSMKEGQVSDIVETQYGYHIILLVKRIEATTLTYEEALPSFQDNMDNSAKATYWRELVNRWISESVIK